MILHIIAFKNEKIGAFTQPHYVDIEPEKAAIQLKRSMKLDVEKATPYQNLTMWYLGDFDDEEGIFISEGAVMLLDCRTIWKELKDELLCKTSENGEN